MVRSDLVRFGIVGFGLHAVKRLMPGFAAAEGCRVTALTRRDPEAARTTAERYGIPHAFTSVEELCRRGEVDAVLVATPDACHHPDVLAALAAGYPVLCEKPLAMNGRQAREMAAAAGDADLPLGVAQVFRFCESVALVRDLLAAGEIGRVEQVRVEFGYPARESPRTWIDDPGRACGGPLADVGIHCIDTLRYLVDDEIVETQARAISDPGGGPFERAAVVSLRLAGGGLGVIAVSGRTPYRTALEVVGETGSIHARDALNVERTLTVTRQSGTGDPEPRNWTVDNRDAYRRQVEAFTRTVREGIPFACPGGEGLKDQLVLDAVYRSLDSGSPEPVEEV